VIDTVTNLLFRCGHKRLTRPVTPVSRAGKPLGDTYVVCLDCGKQFRYDLREMRIGKPLPTAADVGVLPPGMPRPRKSKLKLAVMAAALPLGFLIGAMSVSQRRRTRKPETETPKPPRPDPEQTR